MGIDHIRTYADDICRDFNILGNNVYLEGDGRGQGCDTIWFKTVPIARKALKRDGRIMRGGDLFDCRACACSHSFNTPEYKLLPQHACRQLKERYAKQFEPKKRGKGAVVLTFRREKRG